MKEKKMNDGMDEDIEKGEVKKSDELKERER